VSKKNPLPRNYIGEWFGHRLYPTVKCTDADIRDFLSDRCPFLSEVVGHDCQCVKNDNSKGVCTITTTTTGVRDWMVCPYRSLDSRFFETVVERLFGVTGNTSIAPVVALSDPEQVGLLKLASDEGRPVFVFFQDKLGGEINVSATMQSPELSFDITVIRVGFEKDVLVLRDFGIYEVQTMDFHGSYRHAVSALRNAVDLHASDFPDVLATNVEWLGRKIEGPNIANVFKRTFYQMLLKFRLAQYGACSGVALGLPKAVWESWAPHLSNPNLVEHDDYMVLEGSSVDELSNAWLLVFQTDTGSDDSREALMPYASIRVDVDAFLHLAFTDVPEYIGDNLIGNVRSSILSRVRRVYPSSRSADL